MPYGSLKIDKIIYTRNNVDNLVTVSGLAESTTGNLTLTGTASGAFANFSEGRFTTLLSGVLITGNTIQGANITGVSGTFTSNLSGAVITGNTINGTTVTAVTGNYTTRLSGATITGNAGQFTTLTGGTAGFTTITGTTITGNAGQFTTLTGGTAGFTTVTGTTVTGNVGQFNTLTGNTAGFTTVTGTTVTGATGLFTSLSTATAGFTTITGTAANFVTITGATVTGTSGLFVSGIYSKGIGIGESAVATFTGVNAFFSLNGVYVQTVSPVAALNIDCSSGNYYTKTIAGNSTFTVSNVPASGRSYAFTIELTVTSGNVTWFGNVQFPGGTAPTLITGKTHLISFITDDGGTRWRGSHLTNYTT